MIRIFVARNACPLLLLAAIAVAQAAQPPSSEPAPGTPMALVKKGEKLSHEGKQDEALALYGQALEKSPDLYEAHIESGIALDLKGDYAAAQEHFMKAVALAPEDSKQQALRLLAFSYAFAGNAVKASEPEQQVFNTRLEKRDLVGAAETCNELARIYLELGDPAQAYKWYKTGYKTISGKADLSETDGNLWLFRWESAQARIAARRGQADEARRHLTAAKAALDKANNPDQLRFYPYLAGYVAFYAGDYKTAIAELQKADQRDPFILVLLGQAYEKSGDPGTAKDYYRKVLEINVHNPTNAFARPIAKKKLESGA